LLSSAINIAGATRALSRSKGEARTVGASVTNPAAPLCVGFQTITLRHRRLDAIFQQM